MAANSGTSERAKLADQQTRRPNVVGGRRRRRLALNWGRPPQSVAWGRIRGALGNPSFVVAAVATAHRHQLAALPLPVPFCRRQRARQPARPSPLPMRRPHPADKVQKPLRGRTKSLL